MQCMAIFNVQVYLLKIIKLDIIMLIKTIPKGLPMVDPIASRDVK